MTTNINSYGGNNSFTGVKSYESGSIADNIAGKTLQSVNSQTGAQLTTQMSNLTLPQNTLPDQVVKSVAYTPTQFRSLTDGSTVALLNTPNTSNAGLSFSSNQIFKLPNGAQILQVIVQPYGYDTLPGGVTTTNITAGVGHTGALTMGDATGITTNSSTILATGANALDAINQGLVLTNVLNQTLGSTNLSTASPVINSSLTPLSAQSCVTITNNDGGGVALTSGDLQVTIFYIGV